MLFTLLGAFLLTGSSCVYEFLAVLNDRLKGNIVVRVNCVYFVHAYGKPHSHDHILDQHVVHFTDFVQILVFICLPVGNDHEDYGLIFFVV